MKNFLGIHQKSKLEYINSIQVYRNIKITKTNHIYHVHNIIYQSVLHAIRVSPNRHISKQVLYLGNSTHHHKLLLIIDLIAIWVIANRLGGVQVYFHCKYNLFNYSYLILIWVKGNGYSGKCKQELGEVQTVIRVSANRLGEVQTDHMYVFYTVHNYKLCNGLVVIMVSANSTLGQVQTASLYLLHIYYIYNSIQNGKGTKSGKI